MSRRAAPAPLPVTVLRGHSSGVQGLCFLNENVLLSGSQDGLVKVWNLERRRACAEFQATGHGNGVQKLDRLGSRRVISQGRDMFINVWDAERLVGGGGGGGGGTLPAEPLQQLATGAFHFCQFALTRWRGQEEMRSPGGDEGATISSGNISSSSSSNSSRNDILHGGVGRRRRGENDGHEEQQELRGEERERDAKAATSAAGPKPPGIGEEEQEGGEELGAQGESSSAFEDNVMLAPCGELHSISLWDLRKPRPAFSFAPKDADKKGMVMCVRLLGESPSCASPFAAVGHDSGHLCVYDLRATSAEPMMESRLHTAPLLCVDVGSSCKQGVSGSADESIKVFRMSTRKASCEVVKTFTLEHPGTCCVEIRRDQKLFLSGGWDHRVRAYSWKSPRPLAVLRSHEKSVYTVAYSPRIGGFASGSGDSRVAVWELFPKEGGDSGGDCGDSRRGGGR